MNEQEVIKIGSPVVIDMPEHSNHEATGTVVHINADGTYHVRVDDPETFAFFPKERLKVRK